MKALIVIAHPNDASFSHAMAQAAAQTLYERGYSIVIHDLYVEQFDPILTTSEETTDGPHDDLIEQHCSELQASDLIAVFHPNWWGQPPAILKGWIDRVFRPGVAYEYAAGVEADGHPQGLLHAHSGLVFATSNTASEREQAVFGNSLQILWRNCVFDLCGVARSEQRTFGPMSTSSAGTRLQWLEEVTNVVANHA